MASSATSTAFLGVREEDLQPHHRPQQLPPPHPSAASADCPRPAPVAPPKKKRNLPGNPHPDAEVIALSPKTLLATNRFICEVCNKGFQREQNLQLHRRGHNLPWKLKQKGTKEVRRRVYLCPEPSCVHHDPSRALGDLTGIKKHYCRKHGEKKWKCDKCSKRYAVQSDWKAHAKICGTREYRCDCGTLFSRRDSFITHRAFCDALAQESARAPSGLSSSIGSHLYRNSNMGLGLNESTQVFSLSDQNQAPNDLLRLGGGGGFSHLVSSSSTSVFKPPQTGSSSSFYLAGCSAAQDLQEHKPHPSFLQNKSSFHGLMQFPDLQNGSAASFSTIASAAHNLFDLGFFSGCGGGGGGIDSGSEANPNGDHLLIPDQFSNSNANPEAASFFAGNLMGDQAGNSSVSSLYSTAGQDHEPMLPQMSATALLHRAAQMGSSTSSSNGTGSSLFRGFGISPSSSGGIKQINFGSGLGGAGGNGGESRRTGHHVEESEAHLLRDLVNTLQATGNASMFGGGSGGSCIAGAGDHIDQKGVAFGGFDLSLCNMDEANKLHQSLCNMEGSEGLTRDFLGVGNNMVREVVGASGVVSQREPLQGLGMVVGPLDSESANRSFAGGSSLQ